MYELTFLINDEAELKNIEKAITSLKGKIVKEKKWDKRELAYPIKKFTSADYYTWIISLDEVAIAEFKKKLNFNEKMIRYLLLKAEDAE